ncbi:MAG: hypothetical protein AVDCRST_MAG85-2520, partial [uncultured Solirubrobacteraceae bacterium]
DRPRRVRGRRPGAVGSVLRRRVLLARRAAPVPVRGRGRVGRQRAGVLDRPARPSAAAGLRPRRADRDEPPGGRRRAPGRPAERRHRRRSPGSPAELRAAVLRGLPRGPRRPARRDRHRQSL